METSKRNDEHAMSGERLKRIAPELPPPAPPTPPAPMPAAKPMSATQRQLAELERAELRFHDALDVAFSQENREVMPFERMRQIVVDYLAQHDPAPPPFGGSRRSDRYYVNRAARQLGAIGGKVRAARMTPEQRSASAKKAVRARMEKYKQKRRKK